MFWIARCTRPDISFAVHKATLRTHQQTMTDRRLAKRIAQYMKDTKALELWMCVETIGGHRIRIESWSDADFVADKGDRKSVTGGVMTMDRGIVPLICKKQTGVSLSTMEADFTSASDVGRELLVLRRLVHELGFEVAQPMPMHMDNQVATKQRGSEDSMASAKHVDIRIQFVCDFTIKTIIKTKYVESGLMMAELLAKALPAARLAELRGIFSVK